MQGRLVPKSPGLPALLKRSHAGRAPGAWLVSRQLLVGAHVAQLPGSTCADRGLCLTCIDRLQPHNALQLQYHMQFLTRLPPMTPQAATHTTEPAAGRVGAASQVHGAVEGASAVGGAAAVAVAAAAAATGAAAPAAKRPCMTKAAVKQRRLGQAYDYEPDEQQAQPQQPHEQQQQQQQQQEQDGGGHGDNALIDVFYDAEVGGGLIGSCVSYAWMRPFAA